MTMKTDQGCAKPQGACASLPELVRMNYFHGQLIGDRDLRTEQDYFRARLRHANRCLHGYGVLCGLEVDPLPAREECRPEEDDRRAKLEAAILEIEKRMAALKESMSAQGADPNQIEAEIRKLEAERELHIRQLKELGGQPARHDDDGGPGHVVELACGAAIDCDGNDIIVRYPVKIDLDDLLKCAPRDEAPPVGQEPAEHAQADDAKEWQKNPDPAEENGGRYAWLSICYKECGREPTRPFELDECATSVRCHDARVVEGWRLAASWQRPAADERCETCCTACGEACLLVARIRIRPGRPVRAEDIDHSVRRRFGLYEPTVIDGIGWRHGFEYSYDVAHRLLGSRDPDGGLEIRFSRPVRRGSLGPGVVDLWRITGGRGGAGEFLNMEAEYVGLPDDPDAMVDRLRIRNGSEERVQSKDRILITVRTPFILDACCRAVEGAHLGGRVPRLSDDSDAGKAALEQEAKVEPPGGCANPPHGPVPWTTGAGGNFESWFYISEE